MKSGKNDVSFKFSSFFYRKVLQIQKKRLPLHPQSRNIAPIVQGLQDI